MTPAQEKGATDTMQFPFDVVQWSQLPSDPGKVNIVAYHRPAPPPNFPKEVLD